MHYLCSQRKDYSNSLTLYVPPDITSSTFHTCHGWTWGLCSLDFIQCLLHDLCFRHSGLRLGSLGALCSCSDICRPQKLKAGSTGCWEAHLVQLPPPHPPTCSHDLQCKPSGCLLLGLVLELDYPRRRGFVLPGPGPFQSHSCLDFFPCRVLFRLCECHTIKLKCALREESEIFLDRCFSVFFFKVISTFRYRLRNNKPSVSCQK